MSGRSSTTDRRSCGMLLVGILTFEWRFVYLLMTGVRLMVGLSLISVYSLHFSCPESDCLSLIILYFSQEVYTSAKIITIL